MFVSAQVLGGCKLGIEPDARRPVATVDCPSAEPYTVDVIRGPVSALPGGMAAPPRLPGSARNISLRHRGNHGAAALIKANEDIASDGKRDPKTAHFSTKHVIVAVNF